MQKYNRLQMMLLRGQLVLTELVTLSEKIKNIFMWYHHRKTKELLLLIITILTVLLFIPIRLLALACLFKFFKKGLSHHLRTRELNKVILFEIIHRIIEENGLTEAKAWMLNRNIPYNKNGYEYSNFEKKVKEWMGTHLAVDI